MLKKSTSCVLASLRPSTYPRGYASALRSLRPCWTTFLIILSLSFFNGYFQTESGFSLAAGLPPLMCSSKMVDTSASVTLEYQVASG